MLILVSHDLQGLDSVLRGGCACGSLTEVVGPASAGKTQLCLQLAAVAACLHPSAPDTQVEIAALMWSDTLVSLPAHDVGGRFRSTSSCSTWPAAWDGVLHRHRAPLQVSSGVSCHRMHHLSL